jgi:hypothetical protein
MVAGGCGVLGCLGFGLVAFLALILMMMGRPGGGGGGGGGLQRILQQQVGKFKLVQAKRHDRAIQAGAVDGLIATYQSDDRAQLLHELVALPNPESAKSSAEKTAANFQQKGLQVQRQDNRMINGKAVGPLFVLSGQTAEGGQIEAVAWSNGQLLSLVISAQGNGVYFLDNCPY